MTEPQNSRQDKAIEHAKVALAGPLGRELSTFPIRFAEPIYFGLYCSLDNRKKYGRFRVQWFEESADLRGIQVSTTNRPKRRTGLLHIGEHKNWLFTKALFSSSEALEQTIKDRIAGG